MNQTILSPAEQSEQYCGKVPLHKTNLLQPHGFLLVLDREARTILQTGENINELLHQNATEVVNQPLRQYIGAAEHHKLEKILQQTLGQTAISIQLSFNGIEALCMLRVLPDFLLLEIENSAYIHQEDRGTAADHYRIINTVLSKIEQANSTAAACQIAAASLKQLSGFDKVMIYQFDAQWNGDVVAEELEPGMESYLGLKFPASDVPKQARDLYQTTPYRLIPNINYEPIKLYPLLNPITHAFTDLSASNLRSVAGVHLEYLANMQVQASMSTRILVDGKLWGLIACHHRTPKYLSYNACAQFELLSSLISQRIGALMQKDVFFYKEEGQLHLLTFMKAVYRHGVAEAVTQQGPALLQLLAARGVAVFINNAVEAAGATPALPELHDLFFWAQTRATETLISFESLPKHFEPAAAYSDVASGLLILPVHPEEEFYILAFRPEVVQQVNWGGNPAEALQFEADGKKYHPRASFRQWQQTVKQTALPWRPEELQVAQYLYKALNELSLSETEN